MSTLGVFEIPRVVIKIDGEIVVIDVNKSVDVNICDGCIWRCLQSGPLMVYL
jgi:hypothetical protein